MVTSFEYILSLNDQVSAKLHKLGVSSEAGAEKLNVLRNKFKVLQVATNDFGGSISRLRSEVDLLQAERDLINPKNLSTIRKYNTEIKKLKKELVELESVDGSQFKEALKDGFSQLPSFLTKPAELVTTVVTSSTKMAMGWEQGMAKINATAHLPQAELDKLSDKILHVGADVGVNLDDVPDAYNKIILRTGDVALSTDILDSALRGSKAGFTDVDTVAGALTRTLLAVGKEKTDATEVIDTLFAAKRVGLGDFKDFAQYVPSLVTSAKAVGVGWQDTAGIFAYMTSKGEEASNVTALMQSAFGALGDADIQKGLVGKGISLFNEDGSAKAMDELVGQMSSMMSLLTDKDKGHFLESIGFKNDESKQAFMILTSDVDKLKGSLEAVRNPIGELDAALNNSGTSMARLIQLQGKLQAVAIKLGGVFISVLNPVLYVAMPLFDGLGFVVGGLVDSLGWMFGLLSDGNPIMWGVVSALVAYNTYVNAAIVATKAKWVWDKIVLVSTKAWAGAQCFLNAALKLNPIGLIVAAVAALVTAIVIVVSKTQGWGAQWQVVVNVMKFAFRTFTSSIKLYWLGWTTAFMLGINKIQEGWYKFKNSLGLGDKAENDSAIERIQKDTEERKQALKDAALEVAENAEKTKEAMKWELSWKKSEETNKAKDKVDSATGGVGAFDKTQENNTDTGSSVFSIPSAPMVGPLASPTADKVIDLNTIKASASYRAIADKIGGVKFNGLQGTKSREAIEKTQNAVSEKVNNLDRVEKVFESKEKAFQFRAEKTQITASGKVNNSDQVEKVFKSKEKAFQFRAEKTDYMKLISDHVIKISDKLYRLKFDRLQRTASRETIEKTQITASGKVNNSDQVEKVFKSKERVFQFQPEKTDYMKLISDHVAKIAASLLIAGSLTTNVRAAEDSIIARADYVQTETTNEKCYGGKVINLEKFCEQIVIHVPEGSDKDEVVRLVSDEVINRIKEELS